MEVAARSSLSPIPPYYRKPGGPALPSSLRFCNYKEAYIGCFLHRQTTWRNSCYFHKNFLCNLRNHDAVSWSYFKPSAGLSRSVYNSKMFNQDKLPRCVIVRSELAGTGTADAHHLSGAEFKLCSRIRGIWFYAVTIVAAIFLIVPMLLAHPFVLLLDRYRRKTQHLITKIWALLTVTPFFKIEFEGLDNLPSSDTPAVYVSNHQSFLDIYTLLTLGRCFKFISKTSIFRFPIIGWAMLMIGVIPLKRMDSKSQLDCFKRCMDLIKKGASICIFPEGTRSRDGKLGAFKKGAFSLAAKTGVPVVPITLIGTGKIMPAEREGILNLGLVRVVIHKAIRGSDPQTLCDEARNRIAHALNFQC